MNQIADLIVTVCKDTHCPMVQAVFGDTGLQAVFEIMDMLKELYSHVDPERISGKVLLYKKITPLSNTGSATGAKRSIDFAALANRNIESLCIEIEADGKPYIGELSSMNPEEIAKTAVVYHYNAWHEEFFAGNQRKPVTRLDSTARSQFSVPTFLNLRDALQNFARENVQESTCYIFEQIWHDPNRLFLKAGPESLMRQSLTQYLRNRLGDEHDILPEQNVNERNPVDIRVQPRLRNNRFMIIEIKWLGDSVAASGRIYRYRDHRAKEGAVQLANYLDEQRRFAPSHVIQGYYVIIDARRQGLPNQATPGFTISRSDGFYFETQEIEFTPAPHLTREDFDLPFRMFSRPICSD